MADGAAPVRDPLEVLPGGQVSSYGEHDQPESEE
jgi:hypothetical protein